MPVPVIDADVICTAIEQALREHIRDVLEALGWLGQLGDVRTFQQVPDLNAVAAANLPAVMIGTSRADFDTTRSGERFDGTWQVAVGVRDRGKDHTDTAQRIRRWATAITLAATLDRSLGGIASSVRPISAHYDDLADVSQARTIAAAAIVLEIRVLDAIDLDEFRRRLQPTPTVTSTHSTVSQ